jgi:hypothetical protein
MMSKPPSSSHSSSYRDSLNGSWKLDKSREGWSTRKYLAVMEVDPLAIEAHDRAELEADTVHTIAVTPHKSYRIVKRSRVNNDLVTELPLDGATEATASTVRKVLAPGNRLQTSCATSRDGGKTHISILSTIETVNGTAVIIDTKELLQQDDEDEDGDDGEGGDGADDSRMTTTMVSTRSQRRSVLKQTLVITNQDNHKTCRTTRYFVPVDQHRADDAAAMAGIAIMADDAE